MVTTYRKVLVIHLCFPDNMAKVHNTDLLNNYVNLVFVCECVCFQLSIYLYFKEIWEGMGSSPYRDKNVKKRILCFINPSFSFRLSHIQEGKNSSSSKGLSVQNEDLYQHIFLYNHKKRGKK